MNIELENTTGSDIVVSDMGSMRIAALSIYNMPERRLSELQDSLVINTLISSGDIVLKVDGQTLTSAQALIFAQPFTPEKPVKHIVLQSVEDESICFQLVVHDNEVLETVAV